MFRPVLVFWLQLKQIDTHQKVEERLKISKPLNDLESCISLHGEFHWIIYNYYYYITHNIIHIRHNENTVLLFYIDLSASSIPGRIVTSQLLINNNLLLCIYILLYTFVWYIYYICTVYKMWLKQLEVISCYHIRVSFNRITLNY